MRLAEFHLLLQFSENMAENVDLCAKYVPVLGWSLHCREVRLTHNGVRSLTRAGHQLTVRQGARSRLLPEVAIS